MKLLLIKPKSRSFDGLIEAFQHLGFEVKTIEYSTGIEKNRYFIRLKNRLGFSISNYLQQKRESLNRQIILIYESFQPDIVYVSQGLHIFESTISQICENTFTALSLSDMISLFPEIPSTFPYYDVIYSYDKADIEQLQSMGHNAKFKPAGYNSSIYYKQNVKKDCDISFVGTMYSERVEILQQLIKVFPDREWEIYGEYAPLRFPIKWIKWRFSIEHKYFRNKYLDPVEVNSLYNRSKIVLNIVRANQRDGWSARLPQISGSGTFQITDYLETVDRIFGNCVCMFDGFEDLVEKIKYFLQHDEKREMIAQKGYTKVTAEYSLNSIMKILLEDYNLLKGKNKVIGNE